MMNHNRRYYAGLLESWGLREGQGPLRLVVRRSARPDRRSGSARAERLARRGSVVVRPFRLNDFDAEVDRCQEVYNAAMGDLWGFAKLTEAEFQYFAKQLAQLAIADQVLLAEIDGRPVGLLDHAARHQRGDPPA